jgi:hypothetical protein
MLDSRAEQTDALVPSLPGTHHSGAKNLVSAKEKPPEELAAEDRKADVKAIIIIFVVLVLGALHFVSGWTFDF